MTSFSSGHIPVVLQSQNHTLYNVWNLLSSCNNLSGPSSLHALLSMHGYVFQQVATKGEMPKPELQDMQEEEVCEKMWAVLGCVHTSNLAIPLLGVRQHRPHFRTRKAGHQAVLMTYLMDAVSPRLRRRSRKRGSEETRASTRRNAAAVPAGSVAAFGSLANWSERGLWADIFLFGKALPIRR